MVDVGVRTIANDVGHLLERQLLCWARREPANQALMGVLFFRFGDLNHHLGADPQDASAVVAEGQLAP